MPATRASSNPPAPTPVRIPAVDRLASSSRSTRASSSTPTAKNGLSHHHESADEQTLREAEQILGTPVRRTLRVGDTPTSARDLRHAKIVEAREKETEGRDDEEAGEEATSTIGRSSMTPTTSRKGKERAPVNRASAELSAGGDEDDVVIVELPKRRVHVWKSEVEPTSATSVSTDGVPTLDGETADSHDDDDVGSVIVARGRGSEDESDDEGTVQGGEDAPEVGGRGFDAEEPQSYSAANNEDEDDDDSDEDDSDDSDSSDEGSDSDESEDDEGDSDEEDERLEKLLQAAKISALAKEGTGKDVEAVNNGEVVLQFADQDKKEAPIPDLGIPALPAAHLSFTKDGTAKAAPAELPIPAKSQKARGKGKAVEPELDNRPYERQLSKREKAAQPKKATVSELWATIPTARRDALPQMKRDYQALALANSLDPKRFMKGGSKSTKVPESFAIGTMVDQPRHLQDTTLSREARYRPGQIVQNLARDEDMNATAKRKYGDLQWKRMENGRGRGWKKRSKW